MGIFFRNFIITFVVNCITLSSAVGYFRNTFQANYFGDRVTIENDVINCGNLFCPEKSFKCVITRESYDNNNFIQVSKKCLATDNTITAQQDDSERNPRPGQSVHTYVSATTGGSTFQCNNCDGANSEEIRQNVQKVQERVGNQIQQTQQNVARHMQQVQQHVGETLRRANEQVAYANALTNNLGARINANVQNYLHGMGL